MRHRLTTLTRIRRATLATGASAALLLSACDGAQGPSTDPPVQPQDDGEVEDVDPQPQDDPDREPTDGAPLEDEDVDGGADGDA